jgi:anti-anti-sigma factor
MQDPAQLTVEHLDDLVLVRLEGEVDMGNADRLGRRVVSSVLEGVDTHRPGRALALDLAGLTYIDSSGLRMLEEIRHTLTGKGLATFTIAPETCRAHRLLALTGLVEHLATHPDLDAVRAHLGDGTAAAS